MNLLKYDMTSLLKNVRQTIFNKKIVKIQNSVRKYLLQIRLEKIKEEGTKSVTKISAFYKMKKQRRLFLQTKAKAVRLQANFRAYIAMGKYFKEKYVRNIVKGFYERAWKVIEEKSAALIQRTYRGYKVRKTFSEAIKMMKVRSFMKRAVIKFRYQAFKQLLMRYKKPVVKLQAIVRGRYLRKVFLETRKSALIIQKAYRRHLNKRFYLERLWKKYKANLNTC